MLYRFGILFVVVFSFAVPAEAQRVVRFETTEGNFDVVLNPTNNAALAVNTKETPLPEVQKQLGMQEGFDVGLEMSGNGNAFREMIDNMSHGAKIAVLGIPAKEVALDWSKVIFNMITIKGIYGREMYETWYKMSVMIHSGLDISPIITHRYSYSDFEQGFAAMRSGQTGKVVLDWTGLIQ